MVTGLRDSEGQSGTAPPRIQSPPPYHLATPQKARHKDRSDVALLPVRLLAPLDQLRDASSTLAAELRVPLATQLRLAGLAAFAAQLRVAARSKLCLARLAALA